MRSRFEVYCEILYWGLLAIRNQADDSELCRSMADHLHNLPALLEDFDNEDLHRFYWDIERPCFIRRSPPQGLVRFQALWAELEEATRQERGT